ncbi:hypothetical protein PG994_005946 [Apiospora phragmitis]|uniref:Uncharacterized protein n=1 Tax=Apiospora phragmitis TaxID=2905665 RepID=A0ABR1VDP1_9PEZI
MPAIRPQAAARATRALTTALNPAASSSRTFSSTAARPASHGPQYDPPSGWLFGVKPGEKYQKEGWGDAVLLRLLRHLRLGRHRLCLQARHIVSRRMRALDTTLRARSHHFTFAFMVDPTSIVFAINLCIKTDTDSFYSIQTWALEEARRRLEAEGILEDPEKKR